jgi:hypothetical protein
MPDWVIFGRFAGLSALPPDSQALKLNLYLAVGQAYSSSAGQIAA